MLKKNKGITLVALVVTIIVLIILAGISINLLFGDNGIIKKAQDVSDKYKEAANEENIKLSDLDERMRGILGGDGSQGGSGNGNGNDNPVTPPEVTGPLGTAVNVGNYGNIVYNYTAADLIWRLFYEDSNNIYLISETNTGDYPLNNVKVCNYENNVFTPLDPSYVSGESVSQQGKDLMPLLCGATSSSAGTVSIGTNSNGTNLLTSSNTNPNIWGTAYLCDTTKWTTYKTGPASWAMGGPTAELFAASYNSVDSSYKLALTIENYGYADYSNNNWFSTSFKNGIYRLTTDGRWWIASPNRNQTDFVHGVYDTGGYLGWDSAGDGNSARPVVCISKSTGFTCQFEVPRTGAIGAPINVNNYGRQVTNYTAQDLVWRLFYEDSNNIYLISETQDGDYPISSISLVNSDNSAKGNYSSGADVSQQGKDLMPLLGGATTSSAGTIAIGTNSNEINLLTSSNTSNEILGVAYLCDTTKWLAYKTGQATWAMGGPTIELFAASYNATHMGGNQIRLEVGTYGYTDNVGMDWFIKSNRHGIYRLWGCFWIASPFGGDRMYDHAVMLVDDDIFSTYPKSNEPARPVVCIQKSSGFTYELAPES